MTASVDVVIPAYNAALYLDEALGSVFAQGAHVARVLVVDDASTDTTVAVALRWQPRIEVVRLAANGGGAHARNQGIRACTAPLVAFLDADDRWLAGKLDAQVAALERSPTAAFALCGMRQFPSPELPPEEQAALRLAHPVEAEGWAPSALVARRAAFAQIGVFAEDLRIGEAIDWFNRARPLGHVQIPAVGVERRLHRANTTRLAADDVSGYLQVAHRALQRRRSGAPG